MWLHRVVEGVQQGLTSMPLRGLHHRVASCCSVLRMQKPPTPTGHFFPLKASQTNTACTVPTQVFSPTFFFFFAAHILVSFMFFVKNMRGFKICDAYQCFLSKSMQQKQQKDSPRRLQINAFIFPFTNPYFHIQEKWREHSTTPHTNAWPHVSPYAHPFP